jgi:zinc protease
VGSAFEGMATGGRFTVTSPVRANVTLEAATLMRDIVRDYGATITDGDLALTKESLAKARAREFETLEAKVRLLGSIGDFGLPADVVAQENAQLAALDKTTVQQIATRYLDTGHMIMVVVGDAATQAKRLEALGYGAPVMVPALR